ncbi:HNH endonuclease [Marinococcus luteus]|uniref:HNH endonuclease n=1 Tax=Marinococcus luteus TaxID=1122204 RepID=UPI002ACCF28B|nr:HNH endonuclease [Marinococcus luteus]MDZ5783372.1 HNH endonuclease [Marinococcus luteus]
MAIIEGVSMAAAEVTEVVTTSTELGKLEGSLQNLEQAAISPETTEAMEGLQVTNAQLETEKLYPTINQGYEGTLHPETGVPYERNKIEVNGQPMEGVFPQFEAGAEVDLPEGLHQASDAKQFQYANKELAAKLEQNPELGSMFNSEQIEQIKNNDTPDEYTWHHHEETGKLQLVDQTIHAESGHTGGKAIWGGGSEAR